MSLKVISLLQKGFRRAIFLFFGTSRGPSASAELLAETAIVLTGELDTQRYRMKPRRVYGDNFASRVPHKMHRCGDNDVAQQRPTVTECGSFIAHSVQMK